MAALVPLCTESAPRVGSTLISSTISRGALSGLSRALAMVAASCMVKSPVIWPLLVICSCKTGADMSCPSRMIAICRPTLAPLRLPIATPPSLLKENRISAFEVSGSREGEAFTICSPLRPYWFCVSTRSSSVRSIPCASVLVSVYFLYPGGVTPFAIKAIELV